MKQKLTPYLRSKLDSPSISKQYLVSDSSHATDYSDPLQEDSHEVVKGLIHKYTNRALIKVSYLCAAHCRFCTRIRQIGNPEGTLQQHDIDAIIDYLKRHTEIDDVILSGGDPFLTPQITHSLLRKISTIEHIRVLRIGTRLPLQSPKSFETKPILSLLKYIGQISSDKPFYILLHVEHPDELTLEVKEAVQIIKQATAATLLSQSVFLKGINIDVDTLHRLFRELYHSGVMPYYIYHCDKVRGLEKFEGNIEEETLIMRQLRERLSGIACPTFIADLDQGEGKFPFDLGIIHTKNNVAYKTNVQGLKS